MLTLSLNTVRLSKRVESLQRIVSILLQGISLHSFRFNQQQYAGFQAAVRKVRTQIETEQDEDSAILLTGAAIRLLEEHNDAADAFLRERHSEFEKLISVLSDALLEVGHAMPESMIAMKQVEREIASAADPESLAAVRSRLNDCVGGIRSHAARLAGGPRTDTPAGEMDSITGLPDSRFAAEAMTLIWHRRFDYYAAMFAVEHLDSINMRFGFRAGDQVLLILSQHVAQSMTPADQLFRWRGPCLVALIERPVSEALIAAELSRIIGHRMEHALSIGDREVMVPIHSSWNLFPLAGAKTVDELMTNLNAFALNREGRQANTTAAAHGVGLR